MPFLYHELKDADSCEEEEGNSPRASGVHRVISPSRRLTATINQIYNSSSMAESSEETDNSSAVIVDIKKKKSWKYYVPLTIEPAVFFFCLGSTLTSSITINLFLVHTCEVSLGFNHSVCVELGDKTLNDSHRLETIVQREATHYTLGKSILDSLIPAILSFYIGPWSDINGRKPLIMWPMIGFSLTYMIYLVESLFPKIPVVVLMVSGLPSALSGGFMAFLSGSYSYISDISKPDKRTLRIGMVDVAIFSGLLLGNFSASYIYNGSGAWGYVTLYSVGATCCLLGWLHCLLFVKESVINCQSQNTQCCVSSGVFRNHFIADMVNSCFQKRPNNVRAKLLILIFVLTCCLGTIEGEAAVEFLFTREKFHWNLQNYTIFSGVTLAMNIIGLLIGTHILSSWFHLAPSILTACSLLLKIIAAVVRAISPSFWYLYVGAVLGIPAACIGPWCRTILSNSVPSSEIGKVFGFLASVESLVPLVVSPLYTMFYNRTIWSFPGAFCLLSAGGFSLNLLLMIGVMILEHRNNNENTQHFYNVANQEEKIPENVSN